ncbi:MAG: murein hydrolase [Candidatus Saccharibacteria bacterium]|nr:murein hydrolase [Candidatus Saccharibacteria bacterium]
MSAKLRLPSYDTLLRVGLAMFVWTFLLLHVSMTVSALTPEQKKVFDNGIDYYDIDETDDGTCNVTVAVNLNGNDNIQKAYNYLVGRGLTPEQASGVVGNLMQESGVNPASNQNGGGAGRGIAQWSVDGRWKGVLALAKSEGKDPTDLSVQLDFLWSEMSPGGSRGGVLAALKATSDVISATTVFEQQYESAGTPNMPNRINYAQSILTKYGGGGTPTVAGTVAAPVSAGSTCVGSGQDTQFVDGFTIYSQYDPAWKDKPYGSSTIGVSGCGPSAMAMIITNLTGSNVTPVETANYAASQGLYVAGEGSSWSIGPVLAAHWGLKATAIGNDIAKITATLQAGGLVIAPGQGGDPYTTGGHFIVIRGVTADGKWKVGDSGHKDTSDKDWDPQQLAAAMHAGGVYAITK